MDGTDVNVFKTARLVTMDNELMDWLDEIVSSPSKRAKDLRDPKSVLLACIPALQNILPSPDGQRPKYEEIVKITRSVIASLYLAAETFHSLLPAELTRFQERWDGNELDPASFLLRQTFFQPMEDGMFDHLRGSIDMSELPLHCDGDCHCIVQQLPVGDRGGLPRRVPCARKEAVQCGKMRRLQLSMVIIIHDCNPTNK